VAPKAAEEKKPEADKEEKKPEADKAPEEAADETKKGDEAKSEESAKKDSTKFKTEQPVKLEVVGAPVAAATSAAPAPAKADEAKENKPEKVKIIIESVPQAAMQMPKKHKSKLDLGDLINDLESSSQQPTGEDSFSVPKAVTDNKPKMMIFDTKKPIANAP